MKVASPAVFEQIGTRFRRAVARFAENNDMLLCPGGGLEVDRSPGQRVNARVHDRAERPAGWLLYVTSGDPWHGGIVRADGGFIPRTHSMPSSECSVKLQVGRVGLEPTAGGL